MLLHHRLHDAAAGAAGAGGVSEVQSTPQRSRGARANEHVVASKPRGGGDTARRNSENIMRISRARPGRRPVRLETRWRGQADVAWDWNLTDLVGLEPVILKMSPAGPGATEPGAVGSARLDPTSESWPHPQKTVEKKYCIF